MYSRDIEDRVDCLERDVEQLARTVQVLDEPTGSRGTDEVEDKIQALEVEVEGIDTGLEVVKMHMRRMEKHMRLIQATLSIHGRKIGTTRERRPDLEPERGSKPRRQVGRTASRGHQQ